jgi:hypothetical protein
VEHHLEDFSRTDPDPHLFGELPHETVLRRLIGLDLAARELPVPFEVRARLPLRGEKRAIALDDRCGDENGDPPARIR